MKTPNKLLFNPMKTLPNTTISRFTIFDNENTKKKKKTQTSIFDDQTVSSSDDEQKEWKKYEEEYKQAKEDIENLLKQKSLMQGVSPSGTAAELKSVLRAMELTKNRVRNLQKGVEGDSDMDELDFDEFTGEVLTAFDKAQKKTAKKIIKMIDKSGNVVNNMPNGPHRRNMATMVINTLNVNS
jgi:hypothetical protein